MSHKLDTFRTPIPAVRPGSVSALELAPWPCLHRTPSRAEFTTKIGNGFAWGRLGSIRTPFPTVRLGSSLRLKPPPWLASPSLPRPKAPNCDPINTPVSSARVLSAHPESGSDSRASEALWYLDATSGLHSISISFLKAGSCSCFSQAPQVRAQSLSTWTPVLGKWDRTGTPVQSSAHAPSSPHGGGPLAPASPKSYPTDRKATTRTIFGRQFRSCRAPQGMAKIRTASGRRSNASIASSH